jgi:hypothetical protein
MEGDNVMKGVRREKKWKGGYRTGEREQRGKKTQIKRSVPGTEQAEC